MADRRARKRDGKPLADARGSEKDARDAESNSRDSGASPPSRDRKESSPPSRDRKGADQRSLDLYICLALILAVFAVYAQVAHFDFVNFDDPSYITENPHLRNGISMESLRWALTSGEVAFWMPATRISELLDCQLFGLRSGAHHLMNVVWHVLASLFLFAFLKRATGARWQSAFVAFVFAMHPLHVESVAWVTERKDVLSAFFWFVALWGYVRYAERPSRARYALVLVSFCFGLMSKTMVVTLPLVLVLLDFWPLGRWTSKTPRLKEKIPFLALSVAAAVTSYLTAQSVGAVVAVSAEAFGRRLSNALVSYAIYLFKTIWPVDLAVFYPYPKEPQAWRAMLSALAIAGISIAVLRGFRRRPYLAVGWLWYLVTLVPVIGLVQAGEQAYADRFLYLPMVGLLIMLAWWAPAGRAAAAIAVVLCVAASAVTWVQIGYWRNSETLFRRALEATHDNYLAHYQLGVYLAESPSRRPEAIEEYRAALRLRPANADALNNLGVAMSKSPGGLAEAVTDYEAALRVRPDFVLALNNLGAALAQIPGRLPEAIGRYRAALGVRPESAALHYNLGQALTKLGQWPEAISEYRTALRIEPENADAHNELGSALSTMPGRLPDAIAEYRTALQIRSDDPEIHKNLGNALAKDGRMVEAIAEYQTALRLRPDFAEAHNNLGFALANVDGRFPEAVEQFEAAVRLQPEYRDAQSNLGYALLKLPGRTNEAIAHLEAALKLRPDPQLQQMVAQLKAGKR